VLGEFDGEILFDEGIGQVRGGGGCCRARASAVAAATISATTPLPADCLIVMTEFYTEPGKSKDPKGLRI